MTLQEIRDIFVAEHKYESQKRGLKYIEVPNKLIVSWIAEAQQDIVQRIKPIKTYQDISITVGSTDFELNSNFGTPVLAKFGDADGTIGDTIVDLVDVTDLLTGDNNTETKAAIWWDAANSAYYIKVPTPASAYTIRLWYYSDTLWYSPSGSVAQDFGTFDGTTFTGNIKIPDKFQMAVKFYMLGKAFNDFTQYRDHIDTLKVNKADTMNREFDYQQRLPKYV
jgi:hypothetical protein